MACADAAGTRCVRLECGGTRGENREAACRAALRLLLELSLIHISSRPKTPRS